MDKEKITQQDSHRFFFL